MAGTNLFSNISSTLEVCLTDASGNAMFAKCVGTPPTTTGIFEHGCLIIQTDTGAGNSAIYENTGTLTSPVWNLIGSIAPGEITLAEGSVLIGNAAGKAAAVDAKTTGRVLVGNGTTIASVAMSGDATIVAGGALTIANNAVTTAKILDANVTTAKILDANVTTAKILDANVTTAKILDANITTAKILDANVTLAKLSAGITPSHVVKFAATSPAFAGGGVTDTITVTGALVSDIATAVIRASTNPVSIVKAVLTVDTLTITYSADPGAGTTVDYSVLRAAS
jgi:hypothetical protein